MNVIFSPEDQLCLLLARARFSGDDANVAVERLAATASWDALFERARSHGLIPLVYHRLLALDFPSVPAQVRRKLTDTFGINATRNETLTQELVRILTRLGEAGIRVIPIKGIALAESLYGDVALRTCADLDTLIHPQDLSQGLLVLTSAGYRHAFATPPSIRLLARYGRDCALVREEGRWIYPLQVHCGLIWGGPVERRLLARLWGKASSKPYRSAPAYELSPTHEFLYLAVHAARHGLSSFKWIVDLDWLISRGRLNWNEVAGETRALGWEHPVGFVFSACESLLGTQIPEPLAELCAPARGKVCRSEPGSLEILRQTIFAIKLLPNFIQRMNFIATRLFIPTSVDAEFVRLPSALFFLYFLLRPCRLMLTVLKWLVEAGMSRLRGKPQHSATH